MKRRISVDVRAACYLRDNGHCQIEECGASKQRGDVMNLHHILPEQFGGQETPDNLITLCDIHHKNMHSEFHAFYPDSLSVLQKMNHYTKIVVSKFHKTFGVDDGQDLKPYLKYLTGYDGFRPGQLKTIREALKGKDVLFVTPTGTGKSVCYQLPGLLGANPTLVISPLKALMKDQVESIWSKKIPTTYINSDLNSTEKNKRYNFISKNLYKFIFVAPERFYSKDPKINYLYKQYSHLVIDEAHEIEMWGMAFRPSYRRLGELREKVGNPPVIALTATASKNTQEHIKESLNATDAVSVVTGFFRNNISIRVHHSGVLLDDATISTKKYDYIINVIKENPNQKILIFVPTVNEGEGLLRFLKDKKVNSGFYHSKLDAKYKMEIQNKFTGVEKPELQIMISTSAFGMGIDIPNIRHVIHLTAPLSVTDYVQQIGRAGRDEQQSYAHLLYSKNDDSLLKFMSEIPTKAKDFKEKHGYTDEDVGKVRQKLHDQVLDMLSLIKDYEGKEWEYILDYFGEQKPTYWDKNGKNTVDFLFIILLVILIGTIFLIV